MLKAVWCALVRFVKAQWFSLLLIFSILVGSAAGYFLGKRAEAVKPFGDLFLNGLFATVVPLVTLSGQVTLEGNVAASRTVQFSCTDNAISTALPQTLAFSGETANYTLVAPASAVRVSAKSAWHLRQTVTPAFINNEATVNFALSAGDLNGSNRVDLEDYYLLAAAWYLPNAGADIDGNGVVDLDDYFLLANHWLSDGQAE